MRTRRVLVALLTSVRHAHLGWRSPAPADANTKAVVIIVAGAFVPSIANELLANRLDANGCEVHIFE